MNGRTLSLSTLYLAIYGMLPKYFQDLAELMWLLKKMVYLNAKLARGILAKEYISHLSTCGSCLHYSLLVLARLIWHKNC